MSHNLLILAVAPSAQARRGGAIIKGGDVTSRWWWRDEPVVSSSVVENGGAVAEHGGGGRNAMPLVQTSLHSGGEGIVGVQCPFRSSSQLERWWSQSLSVS
ncbi:hypothetical protein Bca4012_083909 [Brassica carinata]